jgi:hypothetical protein
MFPALANLSHLTYLISFIFFPVVLLPNVGLPGKGTEPGFIPTNYPALCYVAPNRGNAAPLIVHNGAPVHGRVSKIVLKKERGFFVEKKLAKCDRKIKIRINIENSQNMLVMFTYNLAGQNYSSVSLQKIRKNNKSSCVLSVSKAK